MYVYIYYIKYLQDAEMILHLIKLNCDGKEKASWELIVTETNSNMQMQRFISNSLNYGIFK